MQNKLYLTPVELEDFLEDHGLTDEDFVTLIGVTRPALDHWLRGRRAVPQTTIKLIKFFAKYPEMMSKF